VATDQDDSDICPSGQEENTQSYGSQEIYAFHPQTAQAKRGLIKADATKGLAGQRISANRTAVVDALS